MTQYIQEINGVSVQAVLEEDAHTFGDSWVEVLATGLKRMQPITFSGFYDDTASTGPNAVFNSVGSTRTLAVTYGSTNKSTVETVIQEYTRTPQRGRLTRFSVTVLPTGSVTEA